MPQIVRLSASVVNKIAAGEVIERPASVVKELVENSLDAGALRIDVAIAAGGSQLIRVTDDGGGIAADELLLAVAPHATSKLREADDLFRVATLGFRGEALASIAEVSRLVLRSRPTDQAAAAQLEIVAGQASEVSPAAGARGTTIEVHNLFFNTPVRRKFLRSVSTEVGHVSEAFTRLALAHPHVHFTLRHNERLIHDLPPADPWVKRISQLFGGELADGLIWIESQDDPIRLCGYVADPAQNRSHQRMQYLFLNGRHIRDRSLQHALGEAYRGLLMTGRFPITFLQLSMPAELVDVNVHPTKLEVRFQEAGRHYNQLLSTIRTRFLSADLTAKMSAAPAHGGFSSREMQAVDGQRQQLSEWAQLQTQRVEGMARQSSFDMPPGGRAPLELHRVDVPHAEPPYRGSPVRSASMGREEAVGRLASPNEAEWAPGVRPTAIQVHNCYLVVETPTGMLVIDQHALHERILYERFRERVLAGSCETQRLLVPEPVDLSPNEVAVALERQEILAQLGIGVEHFGGDTILVTSYPAMLSRITPAEVLRSAIDGLLSSEKTPERRDLLDELLHMMACKAAVKAGDRLTPEEIQALLEQRHLVDDPHHCPHGRPTALMFTREELDKQFKRI
jgi:DNA mismatch repair protein MutL